MNNIPEEEKKFRSRIFYIGENKTKIVINYKYNRNNKKALIWIPGRNDYFYHYHLSNKLNNINFYCIDLRYCGSSIEKGQIPHYCNNLEIYFEEIDLLFEEMIINKNYDEVILYGHSTGGLISCIYLDYNKKNGKNYKIDKLILNSPFLYIDLDYFSYFLANYIIYYISDYIPSFDINMNYYKKNLFTDYIKKIMKIDINKKSHLELPIMSDWLSTVIYHQNRIKNNLINIEIPILFFTSDKSVDNLENEIGDNILNVDKICEIGKKLSKKKNIFYFKIENALHDIFISNGDFNDIKTPLGKAYNLLKKFLDNNIIYENLCLEA